MITPSILVADDDQEWRDLLGLWLTGKGYRVRFSENGKNVLPMLAEERPDCVILDFDLGDMEGSRVSAAIRADSRLKTLPIIILTSMAGEMKKAVSEGSPDQFIVKSKSPEELLLVLGMLCPSDGNQECDPSRERGDRRTWR